MVTVISLASVVGVVVLPIMSKDFYSKLMTGLIGLAVGSLAASAVFHLIPGAFRHLLLVLRTISVDRGDTVVYWYW